VNYLIGTNIISEVRKGARCDANVAQWYGSIDARRNAGSSGLLATDAFAGSCSTVAC